MKHRRRASSRLPTRLTHGQQTPTYARSEKCHKSREAPSTREQPAANPAPSRPTDPYPRLITSSDRHLDSRAAGCQPGSPTVNKHLPMPVERKCHKSREAPSTREQPAANPAPSRPTDPYPRLVTPLTTGTRDSKAAGCQPGSPTVNKHLPMPVERKCHKSRQAPVSRKQPAADPAFFRPNRSLPSPRHTSHHKHRLRVRGINRSRAAGRRPGSPTPYRFLTLATTYAAFRSRPGGRSQNARANRIWDSQAVTNLGTNQTLPRLTAGS